MAPPRSLPEKFRAQPIRDDLGRRRDLRRHRRADREVFALDRVNDAARRQDAELEEVYKTSPLPHAPDRVAIDALCVRIVEIVLSSLG